MNNHDFIDKKRYLNRYRNINARLDRLEDKLTAIDYKLSAVKSRVITDMPKGGQPLTWDDLLAEKEETEQRINNLAVKARRIRLEVCLAIDSLEDPTQVHVMERYYIERRTLEQIADEDGYSMSTIKKIYHAAMRHVDCPKIVQELSENGLNLVQSVTTPEGPCVLK